MSKSHRKNRQRNRRQRQAHNLAHLDARNSRYDLAHTDESTWQHFDKSDAPNTPITSSLYDSRSTRIVSAWKRDGRSSLPHDSGYFERNDNSYHTDKSTHIPHGMTHVDNPIRWKTVWIDKVSTSSRTTRTIGTMNSSDRAMEQVNNKTIKHIWNKPN